MRFYQVGGAVRDKVLKRQSQDKDYVVLGGTEAEMQALGFKKVGKSFPVFLHPQTGEEYALARKEIKTGKRHQDFKFEFTPDITLQEDSLRRDFTCNALYFDEEKDEIIDYHNGIEDINKRVLRHISAHFCEDPLRILRMCRFAAQLDFSVAPETMELCREMVKNGELKNLSNQRIWNEIEKALHSQSFDKFITTARECGALKAILPEIDKLWQVPERLDYHPEGNSGQHTLLSVRAAGTKDAFVNFGTLLHDVGKGETDPQKWPSHKGHDVLGDKIIVTIAQRLHFPTSYTKFARFCALNHMVSHNPLAKVKKQLMQIAIGLHNFPQKTYLQRFIEVMSADIHGRDNKISEEDENNFEAISGELRDLYDKVSSIRLSNLPEFRKLLESLKNKEINKDEFQNQKTNLMLREIKKMQKHSISV